MDYNHIKMTVEAEKDKTITPYNVPKEAIGGAIVAIQVNEPKNVENGPLSIRIANPDDEYTEPVLEGSKTYPVIITNIRLDVGESLVITSGISGKHIVLNITERFKEN